MTSIETIQIPDDTRVLPVSTVQGEPTFPWKLHQVLQESERLGFSNIISWQGERTFRVHNQALFESRIMRKYFKQTQYRSFQRQLNIYGFRRVKTGVGSGVYTHPFFVRGKPTLCSFMIRSKVKRKGLRSKRMENPTENFAFSKFNSINRIIALNSVPDTSQATSNTTTESKIVGKNASLGNINVFKNKLLEQVSLVVHKDNDVHTTASKENSRIPRTKSMANTNNLTQGRGTGQEHQQNQQNQSLQQLLNMLRQQQQLVSQQLNTLQQQQTQPTETLNTNDLDGATKSPSPQIMGPTSRPIPRKVLTKVEQNATLSSSSLQSIGLSGGSAYEMFSNSALDLESIFDA